MSSDYALTTLTRSMAGLLNRPWIGRKIRQVYTRYLPTAETTVRGVPLTAVLPLHQVGTFNEFAAWERREPSVLNWLDGFTEPFTFVDVGANFGTESLYVAKKFSRGRVIACDPELIGSYNLAVNIRLNGLTNIRNYVVAVADAPGWIEVPENVNYLYPFGPEKYSTARKLVRAERLDDLITEPVDYLKIDVDGLEGRILAGAAGLIGNPRLRSMMVEVDDPGSRDGIVQSLAAHGFARVQDPTAEPNNLTFTRP